MRNRFRNPIIRLTVLVMFALSGSGLLPTLLGGLAKLDGEHSVGVTQTCGATVIVLGHAQSVDDPVAPSAASHRHSGLADFVLAFGASEERDNDHLIAFSHSEFSRETDESRTPLASPVIRLSDIPGPVIQLAVAPPVRPDRLSPAATARLRTIVLLV